MRSVQFHHSLGLVRNMWLSILRLRTVETRSRIRLRCGLSAITRAGRSIWSALGPVSSWSKVLSFLCMCKSRERADHPLTMEVSKECLNQPKPRFTILNPSVRNAIMFSRSHCYKSLIIFPKWEVSTNGSSWNQTFDEGEGA